jgi:hypothetical protein
MLVILSNNHTASDATAVAWMMTCNYGFGHTAAIDRTRALAARFAP